MPEGASSIGAAVDLGILAALRWARWPTPAIVGA
jgi:hypothetical protein